jgi:choline dehydrogenase-like flavoprotein
MQVQEPRHTDIFDAVIVGSGASGGWAAKRLSEAGLKVLVLEAGRPQTSDDYSEHIPAFDLKWRGRSKAPLARIRPQQSASYACDEWNHEWYVNDLAEPYTTPPDAPFPWVGRIRMVGGRTNVWGRQSYRWSDADFKAASHDGAGVDWPLGYTDLAPYYDIVERYIGVSGRAEGHPLLPDGVFQPPMDMTCVENDFAARVKQRFGRTITIGRTANLTRPINGRAACHYCGPCEHGCVTHSYFNAAYTTIPDAVATGRCTLVTNAMVSAVLMDSDRHRARGVRYIDRQTRAVREVRGKVVLLCAQMFESVRLLFNSRTRQDPEGLGNSSGQLGRNLMVHFTDAGARGTFPEIPASVSLTHPRRPNGLFGVRFRNVPGEKPHGAFLRGYGYQLGAGVSTEPAGSTFGEEYKRIQQQGVTTMHLQGFGECLPHPENFCDIDPQVVDAYGIPALRIHMTLHDNDRAMLEDMADAAAEMLDDAGAKHVRRYVDPRWASHEMGCARMGTDPKTSVLTPYQQVHDISNLFVLDASGFATNGWSNPTLTIMALAVRATDKITDRLRNGDL